MFSSRITHLQPVGDSIQLMEVWEFKYDDPSDYAWLLDNLGYCFESGEVDRMQFTGPGECLGLARLHWVMLGKLTNMTRLGQWDESKCPNCRYHFQWRPDMGGECPNCGGAL